MSRVEAHSRYEMGSVTCHVTPLFNVTNRDVTCAPFRGQCVTDCHGVVPVEKELRIIAYQLGCNCDKLRTFPEAPSVTHLDLSLIHI